MGVYDLKQYILVNKSLGMRPGKIAAQAAHASLAVFFNSMTYIETDSNDNIYECRMNDEQHHWKLGAFAKVCLSVPDQETILNVLKIADEDGIIHSVIRDNGITQVVPNSLTTAAIGPIDVTADKNARIVEALSTFKLL
jgi:PTH2 family peptidyl-tRNA hydrolase